MISCVEAIELKVKKGESMTGREFKEQLLALKDEFKKTFASYEKEAKLTNEVSNSLINFDNYL